MVVGKYPKVSPSVNTPLYCHSEWDIVIGTIISGIAQAHPAIILPRIYESHGRT